MTARLVPIGLITLVFNLGGGLVAPALPLYARTLGADYRDLGLIGASHGLAFALLTIPLGRASDRFGRRAILLLSTIGVGASAALYLVAGHVAGSPRASSWRPPPGPPSGRRSRPGSPSGSARGPAPRWASRYGAYAAAFVVGSSLGGFVIEAFGLRAPFALYLATSALAAILVLALAGGEAADPEARHGVAVTPRIVSTDPAWARSRRALAYATGFVYVYGLGTCWRSCRPTGRTGRCRRAASGSCSGTYWIARVVGSLGAGRVSDAWAARLVLVPAMLAMARGRRRSSWSPAGIWALFLGAVALGLAAGASAPTCVGLIADHASADTAGDGHGALRGGVRRLDLGLGSGGWLRR